MSAALCERGALEGLRNAATVQLVFGVWPFAALSLTYPAGFRLILLHWPVIASFWLKCDAEKCVQSYRGTIVIPYHLTIYSVVFSRHILECFRVLDKGLK